MSYPRPSGTEGRTLAPGIREIEHTADLAIVVEARSLEELFDRAARGTMALMHDELSSAGEAPRSSREEPVHPRSERPPDTVGDVRRIDVTGDEVALVLARWLRELLFLHEAEGFVYLGARFERLDAGGVAAEVAGDPHAGPPVRELKAVTYHGLQVVEGPGGWRATVVFDV